MSARLETRGRRHYVVGLPYEQRGAAKAAGCRWDPDARAWWSGKREIAESVLAAAGSAPSPERERDERPEDRVVAGRCRYQTRAGTTTTCYVAGRVVRGHTHWDDRVAEVVSRDGARVLLVSRDGTRTWWAELARVEAVSAYQRPKTIGSLQRFAREARENGGVHPDACSYCGSTSCSAAYGRGGLCDED